jgi:threonine dehydratase
MVESAPRLKVDKVRALGAHIVAMSREQLYEWMRTRAWQREPEAFIHPFADETVMAGHGTLAAEILERVPDVQRVIVPVGGGGLICGIASTFAALNHPVTVVGVQSDGYPLWPRAIAAGGPVPLVPQTIADGTTAPFDEMMFERLRALVDTWILVPEDRLRQAVVRLMTDVKVVAEGAGALAFAAMTGHPSSDRTVAVLSGGNIDRARLAELLTPTSEPQ